MLTDANVLDTFVRAIASSGSLGGAFGHLASLALVLFLLGWSGKYAPDACTVGA